MHSLDAGRIGAASWQRRRAALSIPAFDVLILGIAFAVLGGLQLLLRATQLGRELRATAEDADTAELVGVNARAVYARATAIAVATAALAGVFFAMRSTFDPNAGATELIYAFEAVVIGGIGLALGHALSAGSCSASPSPSARRSTPSTSRSPGTSSSSSSWSLRAAGRRARDPLPRRRSRDRPRRCRAARRARRALDAALALASPAGSAGSSACSRSPRSLVGENSLNNLIQLYFLVILAVMWNALAGYGGLVSVGQQGFIGIGAYAAVFLSVQHGLNPYLSMLLATLIGGAIAIPVALARALAAGRRVRDRHLGRRGDLRDPRLARPEPGDRRRHRHLGPAAVQPALRRRRSGCTTPTGPRSARRRCCSLILFVLLRSRLGASLQAIRDDEEAAASVGVRVLLGKGVLFVLAGAGCAAAGTVILAWQLSILPLGPDSIFGVNWSAQMIFMVLVGGLGTFEGPIIGAVVLYLLQTYVSSTRRLVLRHARRDRDRLRAAPAARDLGHGRRPLRRCGSCPSATGCAAARRATMTT